jgi:hypothetical protein
MKEETTDDSLRAMDIGTFTTLGSFASHQSEKEEMVVHRQAFRINSPKEGAM